MHWKDWCWSWNSNSLVTWWEELTPWKRHWCWERIEGKRRKGWQRFDETVGWHHRLNGHKFEQAPGVGDGQGGLACCSPWGHKVSNTTEWLNRTDATHHAWILFLPRKRILEDRNEFTLVYLGITLNTLNTRCPEYTEITWRACAHL